MTRIIKQKDFSPVAAIELGYGLIGKPLMNVHVYLLDNILIDTAQANMQKEVLSWLEDKKISQILLTHHHEDHSGNALAISKAKNVPVYGNSLTVEKMIKPSHIFPYQKLVWGKAERIPILEIGETVETENHKLLPILTPGHAKDHMVFLEQNEGWLFSGDVYLGEKIKFFRADEVIGDQIESLKKLQKYDFDKLFCCHRPELSDAKRHLANKLQYLQDIHGTIGELLNKGYRNTRIEKSLDKGHDKMVKAITFGNVSFKNLVRSSIESHLLTS